MIPITNDPMTLLDWAKSTDLEQEDQGQLFDLLIRADERIEWLEEAGKYRTMNDRAIHTNWTCLWIHLLENSFPDPGVADAVRDMRPEVKRPEIQGVLF